MRIKNDELRRKIVKAIKKYNKYRAPEAEARLAEVRDDELEIELSGSFCMTCGFYDWIDDLRWDIMDEVAKEVEIVEIDSSDEPDVYKVRMKIKDTDKF